MCGLEPQNVRLGAPKCLGLPIGLPVLFALTTKFLSTRQFIFIIVTRVSIDLASFVLPSVQLIVYYLFILASKLRLSKLLNALSCQSLYHLVDHHSFIIGHAFWNTVSHFVGSFNSRSRSQCCFYLIIVIMCYNLIKLLSQKNTIQLLLF